ncbi:hypothetical protein HGA88_00425 [Candidatus Roizmanbacteria bacterium]|nr:hypothetical protein [Candidatus Roizmanbacteria bacterium]
MISEKFMEEVPYFIWIYLSSTLLLVLILFYSIYLRNHEKNLKKKEQELLREPESELKDAHEKALFLVQEATTEATRMLDGSKETRFEALEKINTALQELAQQNQKLFEINSEQLRRELEEALKKAGEESVAVFHRSMEKVAQEAESQTKGVENSMNDYMKSKLDSEFAAIKEELIHYKEEEMKAFKIRLENNVKDLALEILGKTLSLEDHDTLIVAALEKANKEGLFR